MQVNNTDIIVISKSRKMVLLVTEAEISIIGSSITLITEPVMVIKVRGEFITLIIVDTG